MKNTQFKVEDIFDDKISKDSISPEQITNINDFFSQNNVTKNKEINFIFLNLVRRKLSTLNRLLLLSVFFDN